jgi:hypothetical protein
VFPIRLSVGVPLDLKAAIVPDDEPEADCLEGTGQVISSAIFVVVAHVAETSWSDLPDLAKAFANSNDAIVVAVDEQLGALGHVDRQLWETAAAWKSKGRSVNDPDGT